MSAIPPEVPAEEFSFSIQARRLLTISGLTVDQLASIFGVSSITYYGWMEDLPLNARHKEHFLGVLPLIEEATRRLSTPGTLSAWLLEPASHSGKKPLEYLSSRQYDIFRGFLLRQGTDQNLLHPPKPLGFTYIARPREEIEDELARLQASILLEEDYPD
jgi:transcriptional regulator with XRE-family HTH domain